MRDVLILCARVFTHMQWARDEHVRLSLHIAEDTPEWVLVDGNRLTQVRILTLTAIASLPHTGPRKLM